MVYNTQMGKHAKCWEDRYVVDIETGCWNWIQHTCHGYGQFNEIVDGVQKGVLAHRRAYEKKYGSIMDEDVVRHTCDNSICVNPAHLRIGTHADNVADMDKRQRANRGSNHPGRWLTPDEVRDIRFRLEVLEETVISVARSMGRGREQIRRIRDRKAWSDVV